MLHSVQWEANTGGPSSRTRTERVRSTVLGRVEGAIRCPVVLRIAVDFGGRDPRAVARRWLASCGFDDEQEARGAMVLPEGPCVCRSDETLEPTLASALAAMEGLQLAIVLGLCTPWLYDPRRPVLWTVGSLTRRLELFETQGFYA